MKFGRAATTLQIRMMSSLQIGDQESEIALARAVDSRPLQSNLRLGNTTDLIFPKNRFRGDFAILSRRDLPCPPDISEDLARNDTRPDTLPYLTFDLMKL